MGNHEEFVLWGDSDIDNMIIREIVGYDGESDDEKDDKYILTYQAPVDFCSQLLRDKKRYDKVKSD